MTDSHRNSESIPVAWPLDEHNRKLLANVHPANWVNPDPPEDGSRYNLVVIGAGTAGLVAAAGAAGLGARVALIERELMGGDCLNVGCVPSKALLRCAKAYADVRDAGRYGVTVPDGVGVDFVAVMERMRKLRSEIATHDSFERFSDLGIDVYMGQASFTSQDTVEVDGKKLRFARACIATGARAADLPIEGLKDAGSLTNETVFSLTELPKRLGIIGAGPIGVEMAQAFARFGSKVTLLENTHDILGREDPDAVSLIRDALVNDGVDVNCDCRITKVTTQGDDKIIHFVADRSCNELAVDKVFVGVGRKPNVEGLGLEEAGIDYDDDGVKVNQYLQTSNPSVYAAGDICFQYKFTHTADAMARIVIRNAMFFGRAKTDALTIPWCTYTEPQLAHVGMSAEAAEQQGHDVKTYRVNMDEVDRAILDGETEGFLKVHADAKGRIRGATLVAKNAGDLISELSLAMTAGVRLGKLADTIHPYPTQAEVIKKLADKYNKGRVTPRVRWLFQALMRWRRS